MNKTSRVKIYVIAAAFVAIVIGIIAVVGLAGSGGGSNKSNDGGGVLSNGNGQKPSLPSGQLGLKVVPNATDSLGTDPGKGFVLTSTQDLNTEQVLASIFTTPPGKVKVDANSKREFKLTLENPPAPGGTGSIVFIAPETGATLGSWAYQVRAPLTVVSTLPVDQRTYVPLDTGIEVTFSSDNVIDPQSAFSITPQTQGRFEQHKRTLVFVPQALTPQTLYTVSIKAGVKVTGSDATLERPFTYQFETGPSNRNQPAPVSLSFNRAFTEAPTSEAPLVAVNTQDQTLKQLTVAVYQYPDQKTFIADLSKLDSSPSWTSFSKDSLGVDPTPLKLAMTVTTSVENVSDPKATFSTPGPAFIRFPAALPAGNYLLQTQYQNKTLQAWLQVTALATYAALSETKTVVWVNDVTSGGPVAGAKVDVANASNLGTTNDQGALQADTPKEVSSVTQQFGNPQRRAKGALVVTDTKGRTAVVPLSPGANVDYNGIRGDYNAGAGRDYWHFISTDRPIYQTTDVIHVWGIAKARSGDAKRDIQVQIMVNGDKTVGAPIKAQTDDLGAFQVDVPVTGLGAGYYNVSVADATGAGIDTAYFQVSQYVKPAYRIRVTPSKIAMLAGESYDVEVKATFYDGTPVAGVELKYTVGGSGPTTAGKTITTDQSGIAHVSGTAALTSTNNSSVSYEGQTIDVVPDRAEEGEITGSASIIVFPASVAIQATGVIKDGTTTFTGDVFNIDVGLFTAGVQKALYPFYGYNVFTSTSKPAYLTTPASNSPVDLAINELRYNRTEQGERYDFVNKVTVKVYSYKQTSVPLPKATVMTDAQGHFTYSFPAANPDSSYEIIATAKDSQGRTISQRTQAYSALDTTPSFSYASVGYAGQSVDFNKRWAVNDKPALVFQRGQVPGPSGDKNRYLFYEAQRGIKRFTLQDNPNFAPTFTQDDVPSVTVSGVYFNGFTYVEAVTSTTLRFDTTPKRLTITLTPGKQTYAAGDDASVGVEVKDASGKGVQSEINLAIVDEAVFDVARNGDLTHEIADSIYQTVPSGVFRTYVSHQYPVSADGPGGRGGGGDGARTDFQDVAFFGSVRTDANGKGEVKFKLPDNLTSWRVTSYAVTSDLQAGTASASIPVSQPFFVDVSMNDDYLTSDKPAIRLRAYGTGLKDGDPVQVSVTAPSLGLSQPATATGKAFEPISVPLPALKDGSHDIKVEATAGGQKDAVTKTISVVPSRLVTSVVDSKDAVKPGDTLKGATDTQTSVVFADAGRGRLLASLQRLRYVYGDRFDQTIARVMSAQLINQYFGQNLPVDDLPYQLYLASPATSGSTTTSQAPKGVAILPYAAADLETSSLAAALEPDVFGNNILGPYLQARLDDPKETNERYAEALFGLASLGQPVLLQGQTLMQTPDLGWRGRLHLALAFKALGDDDDAKAMMAALAKEFNEDQAPNKRLRVGTDNDDIIEATSFMAALEAGYDDATADAYYRYLAQNPAKDRPVYLSQLLYLKTALKRSGASGVKFSLTLDGQKKDVSLDNGKTLALSLSAQQLSGLKIDSVSGALSATAMYQTPLAPSLQKASPDITIKRSFSTLSKPTPPGAAITQDSLVEVDLDVTFGAQTAGDCYQITDLLPSGLKPVTRASYVASTQTGTGPKPTTTVIRPNLIDGQRVTFCISKGQTTRFSYYARPTSTGVFTWEPAEMSARSTPGVAALTDTDTVEIK